MAFFMRKGRGSLLIENDKVMYRLATLKKPKILIKLKLTKAKRLECYKYQNHIL